MGMMIVWLIISHAMLIGIGVALMRADVLWLGLIFAVLIPGIRVARRFHPAGGYRLIGGQTPYAGNLSERGGRVLRAAEPRWFKLCLLAEVAVLIGVVLLMLLPRTF